MAELPPNAIVLCALPRTGDIDPAVDGDARSQYFQESAGGLVVRTALMEAYATRAAA
jgi:aspartate carbamoyltransferase catalytic subunit